MCKNAELSFQTSATAPVGNVSAECTADPVVAPSVALQWQHRMRPPCLKCRCNLRRHKVDEAVLGIDEGYSPSVLHVVALGVEVAAELQQGLSGSRAATGDVGNVVRTAQK